MKTRLTQGETGRINTLVQAETYHRVLLIAVETHRTASATVGWLLRRGIAAYAADNKIEHDQISATTPLATFLARSAPGDAGGPEPRAERVRKALAALAYLRNPYDREFDTHGDLGLADDVEVLLATVSELFGEMLPRET